MPDGAGHTSFQQPTTHLEKETPIDTSTLSVLLLQQKYAAVMTVGVSSPPKHVTGFPLQNLILSVETT